MIPLRKTLLLGILCLPFLTNTHAAEIKPVQARSAFDFVDSMGVCLRIFDDASHDTIVRPRLAELGIKHIRAALKKPGDNHRGNGQIEMDRLRQLGKEGYKITGIWSCWYSMNDLVKISESLLPDALYQVEGPNEPWNGHENFKWENKKWPEGPSLYMEDMHSALRANEKTRKLPILSFSGTTSAYKSIEQWLDYGNEHIYTDNGDSLTEKGHLDKLIARCRATQYPTKPLQFTEAGYCSDPKGFRGTSPEVQASGVPRIYLETFRQGIVRTFIYGFLMTDDPGFSLLQPDGTPKPAFKAVQAMRAILDDGPTQKKTPGTLPFSIESKVSSVHHLLLQKNDGDFYLCIWNDIGSWDPKTKKNRKNADQPVKVSFGKTPAKVVEYLPLTNGTSAVNTREAPDKEITFEVPDHPLILKITP